MDRVKTLDKLVTYKFAGILRRKGEDVIDFSSIADDVQAVKTRNRSNIYLAYDRIVKIKIEEVEEV